MAGKQAKILTHKDIQMALRRAGKSRYAARDRAIILLSVKAGLRAGEIAKLTWPMLCESSGRIGQSIELRDSAAKMGSGRSIPMHPALRTALLHLRRDANAAAYEAVIRSERGLAMRPSSVVNWFAVLYRELGLEGCSSHSGRRTFITRAARLVHKAGGSLRDVQLLAGHRSIQTTQRYIDGNSDAQRRLVSLI